MKTFPKFILFIILLFSYAGGYPVSAEEGIWIGGTGSALGTMKIMASEFRKIHKNVFVEILPSLGSGGGIKAVLNGAIDIAVASRPLNEYEKATGIVAEPYGRTPLVFATRSDVAVSDMLEEQLKGILEGSVQYWPDGERMRFILRPAVDSDTMVLRSISNAISEAVDIAHQRPGMLIGLTDQDSADLIEETPGSLGTTTLAQMLSENRSVNILSFNGVAPTIKNLRDGKYTLWKTHWIIVRKDASPLVKLFADFVFSVDGRRILKRTGHLALTRDRVKE